MASSYIPISGEISPTLFEESVVDSPNVVMRVADENGQVVIIFYLFLQLPSQDTKTAVVGDPLKMTWEILDQDSPYEVGQAVSLMSSIFRYIIYFLDQNIWRYESTIALLF